MDSKNKWSFGVFAAISPPGLAGQGLWLVKHNYGKGLWSLPGGGLELGENIVQGMSRENQEETGFQISVLNPPVAILSLRRSLGVVVLFEGLFIKWIAQSNPDEISEGDFFRFEYIARLAERKKIYPAQFDLVELFRLTKPEDRPVYEWSNKLKM